MSKKALTVSVVQKEIVPIIEQGKGLVVSNAQQMIQATEILSRINIARDRVIERMETITKPAKEVIKNAEAVWKPFITDAKGAIEHIRNELSSYQTIQSDIAEAEAKKIADRIGAGKGKLKMSTAMNQIADIEKPVVKIETASGSLKFRPTPAFEIMDVTLLPAKYILPNEVEIRNAMKAGVEVPGVRYFIKQVPVNDR